ncbi:MAG: hypothetical protein NC110_01045 [Ruminococcus sp.]|nr:hypothetical protein [Ruminococcus sp.]
MAEIITRITDFVMSCVKFFQDLIKKIRSGDFGKDEKGTTSEGDIVA